MMRALLVVVGVCGVWLSARLVMFALTLSPTDLAGSKRWVRRNGLRTQITAISNQVQQC